MMAETILVATWDDGVFLVTEASHGHELAGQPVRALAPDGRGGVLAIVDRRALRRRDAAGTWSTLVVAEQDLACCVALGEDVYVGTDDARVLRIDAAGRIEPLRAFDTVAGRDTWYAGTAVIDGRVVGPPLGVRSMTATPDGTLLVNVHVGGIPRSRDRGATWSPTIDVASDVHEVRAHPRRAGVVIAATAVGLGTSHDGGATWDVAHAGLHAPHCAAIAFVGNDVLVSAATDPFASRGAIYRRRVTDQGPLVVVGGGLPAWVDGIVDTRCIDARGDAAAICDCAGNLYTSFDAGRTWSRRARGLKTPSSIVVV